MKIKKISFSMFIFLIIHLTISSISNSQYKLTSFDTCLTFQKRPNSSEYWELSFIHIDNNWSETALAYNWCTGLGTQNSPYLIENVTIDGKQMHNCITIENSDEPFKINNCTLYNSSIFIPSQNVAGIKLNNVSNGILMRNNCSSDNVYGMYLYECENIQIQDNIVNNNNVGMVLNRSESCSIVGNMAYTNTGYGIYLIGSDNNLVFENNANYNHFFGIVCAKGSRNNTIYHNNASLNEGYGIIIEGTNNTVTENYANFNDIIGMAIANLDESIVRGNIVENNMYGIMLTNVSQNLISENYISNNSYYGIHIMEGFGPCDNNIFHKNDLINNSEVGIYIDKPLHFNNLFYQNKFLTNKLHIFDNGTNTTWDDGSVGNYWDNYTGVDSDDDNIGDAPHIIQNNPLRQDNFPIWNDGDDLPPTIKINFPVSSQLIGVIAPAYNVEIHDLNLDTMWYTIDGGATNIIFSVNGTIDQNNWTAHIDGAVTLTFYANDTLGHINSTQVIINKDSTSPIINIISPNPNQLFDSTSPDFIVEISCVNLDTMWYTIDGGLTNITFTFNDTINQASWILMPDGTITIKFYANNTLGKIDFQEVIVRKDVTAPTITINNPQNNDVIGATAPNFELSIDEQNLDKTWYSLNGGNNITFTGLTGTINQAFWDVLSEGNVIIRFYANDTLGRIGFQEVTVVKTTSQLSPPEIPGYDILLLLGIISTIAVIIVRKRLNHLN